MVTNIQNGKYKMIRPLGVVIKAKSKELVGAFVDFCSSSEGRKLMTAAGFAPAL